MAGSEIMCHKLALEQSFCSKCERGRYTTERFSASCCVFGQGPARVLLSSGPKAQYSQIKEAARAIDLHDQITANTREFLTFPPNRIFVTPPFLRMRAEMYHNCRSAMYWGVFAVRRPVLLHEGTILVSQSGYELRKKR